MLLEESVGQAPPYGLPTFPLPVAEFLPLRGRERSQQAGVRREGRPTSEAAGKERESAMELLRRFCEWWRGFWGCDLCWPMEIDSHRWENKVEILRRLGT